MPSPPEAKPTEWPWTTRHRHAMSALAEWTSGWVFLVYSFLLLRLL